MGSKEYRYNTFPSGFPSFGGEGKSERQKIFSILPCTVSQLLSATEHNDSFFVRDVKINQVSVVGLNRKAEWTETNVVYSVDDMTGPPLDVKLWLNIENDDLNNCTIPSGSYIKVQYRFLIAFSIRPVKDLNEITSHMLEVIQAHLLSDAGSYSRIKNKSMTSTAINTSYANDPATAGFTANQRKVFYLIKNCHLAEGITLQRLKTLLEYLSPYDIRSCLQFLINEGHIFSTIDENHFKSTYG
ncbi:replication protein A 32 kDa subunit-like isoform X2 [Trichomycterus rosablanca]|uniref:replication protein A 32 kDa subunit-like isoform X2 n=1 Tax=Trichomycterus rosablanca TaxID=2290929 RepID=UPI002F35BEFA